MAAPPTADTLAEEGAAPEDPPEQTFADVMWTPDHENILVEWADKALCYKWLHAKSHANYSRSNAWFTIPVIIMSTRSNPVCAEAGLPRKLFHISISNTGLLT